MPAADGGAVPDPVTSSGHPRRRGIRLCLRRGARCLTVLLLAGCAEEKPAPVPGPLGPYIRSAPRKPVQVRPHRQPKGKPGTETATAEATAVSEQPGAPSVVPATEQTALAAP